MRSPMHFLRAYGYVLGVLPWLMMTPWRGASRAALGRVARAAGWAGLDTALPTCRLSELVAHRAPIRLDDTVDHEGNTSFYELFALSQLVAERKPRMLLELGTFNGRSTLHMAMNSPDDAQVVTIDLPEHESPFDDPGLVGACYRDTPWVSGITELRENTRRFKPEHYLGRMNFIFIDAGHEYDDVCNDTDLALRLAAPRDCLILWHDYAQWPGVRDALDERYHAGGRFRGLRRIARTSMAVLDLAGVEADNGSSRASRAAAGARAAAEGAGVHRTVSG